MQKGYQTKSRGYIIDYFEAHKEMIISASDIYKYLEQNNKAINLATIYRNLERLTEGGILIKYKTANEEKAVFQYVGEDRKCDEHIHMQCLKCRKVIHMECEFMHEITEHVTQNHGFTLECKNSILYGLCEICKKM